MLNGSQATRFFPNFAVKDSASGSYLLASNFLEYDITTSAHDHDGQQETEECSGNTASSVSLPDLTSSTSISAIRQLPATALKQYVQLYHLPSEGNKQVLVQRLHAHRHTSSNSEVSPESSNEEDNPGSDN